MHRLMLKRYLYAGEIFKQYNDNHSTFIEDRTKGDAIYELMKGVDYDIQIVYVHDWKRAKRYDVVSKNR